MDKRIRRISLSLTIVSFIVWIVYMMLFSSVMDITAVRTPIYIFIVQLVEWYIGVCIYYAQEVEIMMNDEKRNHVNMPINWWKVFFAPYLILRSLPGAVVFFVFNIILNEVLLVIVATVNMDKGAFGWVVFFLQLNVTAILYAVVKIFFYGHNAHEIPEAKFTFFHMAISSYSFIYDSHIQLVQWFLWWRTIEDDPSPV